MTIESPKVLNKHYNQNHSFLVKFYTHFNWELIDLYDDIFTSMGYADGIMLYHLHTKNKKKLSQLLENVPPVTVVTENKYSGWIK